MSGRLILLILASTTLVGVSSSTPPPSNGGGNSSDRSDESRPGAKHRAAATKLVHDDVPAMVADESGIRLAERLAPFEVQRVSEDTQDNLVAHNDHNAKESGAQGSGVTLRRRITESPGSSASASDCKLKGEYETYTRCTSQQLYEGHCCFDPYTQPGWHSLSDSVYQCPSTRCPFIPAFVGDGHRVYIGGSSNDPDYHLARLCCMDADSSCSGHGMFNNCACTCNPGFSGDQCQYSDKATCSGHGTAQACQGEVVAFKKLADGTCACDEGWTGDNCEKSASTSNSCNGHGSSDSKGKCMCNEAWTGDNCEKSASTSSSCNGHGSMGSTGKCSCDEGWTGSACTNSSPSGTSTNKFDSIAWALLAMIAVISTIFLVRKVYHDYSTRVFDDEEQAAGYNRLGDGLRSSLIPHANDVVSRERFKSVEIQRLRNLVLESKEQNKEPNSFVHGPVAVAVPCAPPRPYTEQKEQYDDF